MARLGAVLGGVLAELVRARVIADRLTKDLVAEYEDDLVLTTFSVPRFSLKDADLVLRFSVRDVVEVEADKPDADEALQWWQKSAATIVFPRVLARLNLTQAEAKTVERVLKQDDGDLVGRPTRAEMQKALAGDSSAVAQKVAVPALARFAKLPVKIKDKLGGKTTFQRALVAGLRKEVSDFVSRRLENELVKAALASKVDVAVLQDELPDDPAHIQEIRLAIQSGDLDLVLAKAPTAE